MTRELLAFSLTFTIGAIVGHIAIPRGSVMAQSSKPMFMTRLYTGADNQTHSEEVEVKFSGGGESNADPMCTPSHMRFAYPTDDG